MSHTLISRFRLMCQSNMNVLNFSPYILYKLYELKFYVNLLPLTAMGSNHAWDLDFFHVREISS
jgi:hypothetical protein